MADLVANDFDTSHAKGMSFHRNERALTTSIYRSFDRPTIMSQLSPLKEERWDGEIAMVANQIASRQCTRVAM